MLELAACYRKRQDNSDLRTIEISFHLKIKELQKRQSKTETARSKFMRHPGSSYLPAV